MAAGARALSTTVINNDTERYVSTSIGLIITFATAPTADSLILLYLLPSIDGGVNYVDGGPTVAPGGESFIGAFTVKNVTTQQRIVISDIRLTPVKYKAMLVNSTNQPFPASGTVLRYTKYSYESVATQ